MVNVLISAIDGGVVALGVTGLFFLIPIIAILTYHQRKMAEIIHRRDVRDQSDKGEIQALRAEVYELKQLLHTQMIAMDGLNRTSVPPPTPHAEIEQRLGS